MRKGERKGRKKGRQGTKLIRLEVPMGTRVCHRTTGWLMSVDHP